MYGRSNQLLALEDARHWCIEILTFMRANGSAASVIEMTEQTVNGMFGRGDLRGLQALAKELAEWGRSIPEPAQHRLDALLKSRFGFGLEG